MDGVDLFNHCLAQATAVIKQVRPEHFSNPTPDNDWDVQDTVQHMLTELEMVPKVVTGEVIPQSIETLDESTEDLDIDVIVQWQAAADKAEAAIEDVDPDETVTVDGNEISIDEYLQLAASSLLVYAWDLGTAIGMTVRFNHEVAEAVYESALPQRTDLESKPHSPFAEAVSVPETADLQTKLLALFGRRSDWKARFSTQ